MIAAISLFFNQYKWLVYISGVLVLCAWIWFSGRASGIESMADDVAKAESTAENWKKTAENKQIAIDGQNQAIERMKVDFDTKYRALKDNATKANLEGQKITRAYKKQAAALKSLELSKNECEAYNQLIDAGRNQ